MKSVFRYFSKLPFFEGYGLQPVRRDHADGEALASEGNAGSPLQLTEKSNLLLSLKSD